MRSRLIFCFGLGQVSLPETLLALGEQVLNTQIVSHSYEAFFLRRLFSGTTSRPRHDTMADRAAAVVHIELNPIKYVGYENEGITLTARPSDFLDRTVQGVKFSWESSDTTKLQIDDAGRARFLQAGLAWVTCRAGTATSTAPVLIRPNHRPRQSDADWRVDQQTLAANGTIVGTTEAPKGIGSALSSLVDNLAPTALAQGPPYPDDLGYDQLWNEPRNWVGSPRSAAMASMPLGWVLPEGSNFDWAVPIIGLGGRGLAANLTLHYNSRVWSRRNNQVAFDAITGWPAPGFSLGFGRIVIYDYNLNYPGAPTCKYMLIDADGTRRYLGSGVWGWAGETNQFETSDGSHIVFLGNARDGGGISYPDGTSVSITPVNNRLLPTAISDRNGNYIQIAYKPDCFQVGGVEYCGYFSPIALDYVIDTLGRRIEFQYDSNYRIISITAPGFGGTAQNPITRTLVQFDYQTVTPVYSFTGLTVERAPWTSWRLKHIYFPATSTGYLPTYSQYGMVSGVSVRRQMTCSWPCNPPTFTDGVESAAVSFNYPASGSLTDCPAFTQRTDSAVSWPAGPGSYTYSTSTGSQTMIFTISRPDSTTMLLTRSTDASSPANGRLVQSEVKNGATSLAKTILTYVNDGGGSAQVQSVTSYDDNNAPVKVDFDYDSHGNITNKREYGYQVSGVWKARRRTHTTYTTIGSAVNLPTEVDVYDAIENTNDADDVLIAKATYAYDNYISMGGLENYGGTANPPGHISYGPMGNVTGVTQWTDLIAGTTIQHLAKYDIFGNVVKAQVSCCQEKDLTNTDATYWSQPETETSGDPNGAHQTTSTDYDFNTSLPASAIDAGGLITNIGYDAALNPSSVTLPTGASASAGFDYGNLSSTRTVTYSDMGFDGGGVFGPVTRTLTTTTNYDGWGRVIQTVNPNNAQVNTAYDAMGRVSSRTNPFTAGGTPGPATTIQYDLANKAVITTLPGGNTVRSDYSGATVTATDQVNRKIKRESDGLGRLIKVTEQDVSTGSLTQETSYSYNLVDKLTQVNQGGQYRSYKYDAMGRLLYEKIPEQTATINDGSGTYWTTAYAYTEFSSVKKKTDPRGVETHYAFDALHRATQTWYTGVGGDDSGSTRPALPSGVAATSDVLVGYTSWGAVSYVIIGNDYNEGYNFDAYNRPTSVTRWILGQTYDIRKTYTTSYEYNGGSQLSKIIYPSGQQVSLNHDDKGRMQSLTYNPGDTSGYLTGMSYALTGQVTGLTLGNGVAETFGYDANSQQLATHTATKGATSLMNLSLSFSAAAGQMGAGSTAGNAGQLMTISGTINSTTESAAYWYDNLGRLVSSNQTTNGSSAQRKFAYDRWGNRTTVWPSVFGGTPIQTVMLEQSGSVPTNRITSVTNNGTPSNYLYDAVGNVTNDGVHSYSYDAENRLVKVDNAATASYNYDGQNRRVTKIIGSAWTHYIWEGAHVIAEHDGTTAYSTNPTYQVASARSDYVFSGARMIWNRQRPSSTGSWTASYYLNDRLSVRVVLDSAGNVTGRQAHLPFGEDFAETGTQEKHHFTTYERDSEAGVDYAINRQESPGVGRFMRVDPLSSSAKKESAQSWNRYAYTANDPVNRTDPSGLDFFDPGEPPPCGDEQQTQFVADGYQEVNWCAALSFVWIFEPQPRQPSCTISLNTTQGATPIGRGALAYDPDPSRRFINPAVDLIGGGTGGGEHYFFYEVIATISNTGFGNMSRWDPYQRVHRTVDEPLVLDNGTPFGDDLFKTDLTQDPDNPDKRNVVRSDFFYGLLIWLDVPSAPARPFRNRRILSGKISWQFYFEARFDGKAVCSRSMTLILKYDNGEPNWSVLK